MAWQALPVESDPDAVTLRILDGLKVALPGWTPREGALEVILAEEIGREIAATNARAADAAEVAVAGIGTSIDGLAAITGAPATLFVDYVVTAGGGTIPAGFTVVATMASGAQVAYAQPVDLTFAPGELYPPGQLVATTVGTAGNGAPTSVEVITATSTVTRVAPKGPATGGVDPETRAAYLTRLVAFRSLLRPGGVRAGDLALLAHNTAGVYRALGVDLYDAETATAGVAKAVAIFPVGSDGLAVGAATRDALRADVERVREVGLLVSIGAPTYTALDVAVAAQAEDGADTGAVAQAITAALAAHLSPATWGASATDPTSWRPTPVVRYLELVRAAGSAPGVLFLTALSVNGGEADVTLEGVAALPSPTSGLDPTVLTVSVS